MRDGLRSAWSRILHFRVCRQVPRPAFAEGGTRSFRDDTPGSMVTGIPVAHDAQVLRAFGSSREKARRVNANLINISRTAYTNINTNTNTSTTT